METDETKADPITLRAEIEAVRNEAGRHHIESREGAQKRDQSLGIVRDAVLRAGDVCKYPAQVEKLLNGACGHLAEAYEAASSVVFHDLRKRELCAAADRLERVEAESREELDIAAAQ